MKEINIPLSIDVNCESLKLTWIPPGRFIMGDKIGDDEDPMGEFEVIISQGYWLGVYPVTQCQWESIVGPSPSRFKGVNRPVTDVSWEDTIAFCNELNARKLPVPTGSVFTLPSEAQWEYACWAGTRYKYQLGDSLEHLTLVAWYRENTNLVGTQDVGQKKPNNWGLYDMLGNVMEWCLDSPLSYPAGTTQLDWVGGSEEGFRNVRGGSVFTSSGSSALTCYGRMYMATYPETFTGFRLCLRYLKT